MRIPEMLMQRYNKEHLSYSSLKKALTDIALFDLHMKGKVEYKSDALEFGSMYDAIFRPPPSVWHLRHLPEG